METPKPTEPIWELVKRSQTDGRLPKDFRIPWIDGMFAPGARDGISLYHMVTPPRDPARNGLILKLLRLISEAEDQKNMPEIFRILETLNKQVSWVYLYDEIMSVISANQADLSLGDLLRFSDFLVCKGVDLMTVKAGMCLVGGFVVPFVEDIAMELGPYDEFTYYAARILAGRKDANPKLFRLAQSVSGWGRIFAVRYLRPDTQEIRDWLLYEGAENTVIPQYSADVCLVKSGASQRLDLPVSRAEYLAIGKLIGYALSDAPGTRPCPGLTDPAGLIPKYLKAARMHRPDSSVLWAIRDAAGLLGLDPKVMEDVKKMC